MNKKFYKKIKRRTQLPALLVCTIFWMPFAYASAGGFQTKPENINNYLKKLERTYHVNFVYDATEVSNSMELNVPTEEVKTIQESLAPLKEKSISYQQVGSQVVLKHEMKPAQGTLLQQRDIVIRGIVKDKKTKNPISGVSVSAKGTSNMVATNDKGEYQITVKENAVLVFRFIGYKTEEIVVTNKTRIDVSLEEKTSALDEVVVSTGYQNLNKRLFTGAATTIKASDVKQDGIVDVSRMLEGKVAGVSVQNVSGTFGSAPKIRIRGATSISGENKPLWVVDGIVLEDVVNISNDQLSSGDALTLIGSSVAGINADDIENFDILKDASSTALYGARAMNGVVVITTKKGKLGKTMINYSGNSSIYLKHSYDNYNIMNSADQMSLYAEIYRKGGLGADIVNKMNGGVFVKMYQENNKFDEKTGKFDVVNTPEGRSSFLKKYALANTDWFKVLFRNSFVQEHSLSISLGNEKNTHYVSLGYYKDNGWTIADNVKRYTMNMRNEYTISPKVKIGLIATGAFRQQRAPGTLGRSSNVVEGVYTRDFDINPFSYALKTSRTLRPYDDNGNLEYFPRNYAPFNIIQETNTNWIDLDMLDSKLQGEFGYKFLPNFEFQTVGAMRYVKTSREHKITEYSNMAAAYRYGPTSTIKNANIFFYDNPDYPEIIDKESVLPQGGFYNRSDDNLLNFNIRNLISWKKEFNQKHDLNAFIGQEIKFTNRQSSFSNGYGYQYDRGGRPFTDYRIIKMNLEGNYDYYGMDRFFDRYAAFFANLSYSYDSKYIFNGTFRYDGSNRLGETAAARWLPTWTLSVAWNAKDEDFIKKIKEISYLKVRAGYGLTASMGRATNAAIVLRNGTSIRPNLSEVEPRIVLDALENAELTWEKQYETNLGFELGLFNQLNLTVDYYQRKGFDLIGAIRTSGIGGEDTKLANYADMKSHGIEVSLGGTPIKTADFSLNSNFTFAYNTNKITNYKALPRIFDLIIPEGGAKKDGAFRGLYSINFQKLNGLGTPQFINEDGKSSGNVYLQSPNTDYLIYEGPVDPPYTGGWSNTFNYKKFSFNFFVSYQAGNKIRLDNVFYTNYDDTQAMPKEFLDRWTLPGDENLTNVPSIADYLLKKDLKGVYPYTAYNYSSDRVADGSFVRLKSASLSYSFDKKVAQKIGLNSLSFKLQANNIWLIYSDKKLKGQDPEFFGSGGVALPIPRQITLSLKVVI